MPVSLSAPSTPGAPVAVQLGSTLGGYTLERKLGEAKSTVFLARGSQGQVALKVLPAQLVAKSPTAGKRFLREARSLFSVDHPNLIKVLDAGEDMGSYYLAMEYFEGKSLTQVMADMGGKIPEAIALDVAAGVARALELLREKELIHRNIKPDHVMIDGAGAIKLIGLGLVRASSGSDQPALTVKGAVVGTPQYMSPEQARAGDLDTRADLYSLGITLYVALAGEVPFQHKIVAQVLRKLMTEKPTPVRELNPQASEAVEALIGKLVEKKPEDRYQSPGDLLSDLEAIKTGKLAGGLPPIASGMTTGGTASDVGRISAQAIAGDPRVKLLTMAVLALSIAVVALIVVVVLK
jgi:serine/threonine-protein kinase